MVRAMWHFHRLREEMVENADVADPSAMPIPRKKIPRKAGLAVSFAVAAVRGEAEISKLQ